jgi:hypothetical protein
VSHRRGPGFREDEQLGTVQAGYQDVMHLRCCLATGEPVDINTPDSPQLPQFQTLPPPKAVAMPRANLRNPPRATPYMPKDLPLAEALPKKPRAMPELVPGRKPPDRTRILTLLFSFFPLFNGPVVLLPALSCVVVLVFDPAPGAHFQAGQQGSNVALAYLKNQRLLLFLAVCVPDRDEVLVGFAQQKHRGYEDGRHQASGDILAILERVDLTIRARTSSSPVRRTKVPISVRSS